MADNPHDLENLIKGATRAQLTGKQEGGIVDKISQLRRDYSTGNSQNLHAIEKAIQEYNKAIANHFGDQSVRNTTGTFFTDELYAGFKPKTITGFIDNKKNINLFDFLSKQNSGYFYSMRKVNPDYTGYACRIHREHDNALASVEFDSNGIVSTGSKVTVLEGGEGFGVGFRGGETYANDGRTGTLRDFCFPLTGLANSHYYHVGIETWYAQRTDAENETLALRGKAKTDTFKLNFGNLYNTSYDDDFENITFKIATGLTGSNGSNYGFDGHMSPAYSGIRSNGDQYWFYNHNFGPDDNFSPGFHWILIKTGTLTNNTTLSVIGNTEIRAYSEQVQDYSINRPYSVTQNWVVRAAGQTQADGLPRETLSFTKSNSPGPLEDYELASHNALPLIFRPPDSSLTILCNTSHPSGSILTPKWGYASAGSSYMQQKLILNQVSGSLIMVTKSENLVIPNLGIQTFYLSSTSFTQDGACAIYGGDNHGFVNDKPRITGMFMKWSNQNYDTGHARTEIQAPILLPDPSDITSAVFSGGDFGTGSFNQDPYNYHLTELHNLCPTTLTTGANEVFFNDVKATFVDGYDGTPGSFKETGNLGAFHNFGSQPSTYSRGVFAGEIPEILMFKTDAKNTETERRRFSTDIKSFYSITGGKS